MPIRISVVSNSISVGISKSISVVIVTIIRISISIGLRLSLDNGKCESYEQLKKNIEKSALQP